MKETAQYTVLSILILMLISSSVFMFVLAMKDDAPKAEGAILKALLKGSIYETGEYMSVFGTCTDAYDNPVSGTTGTLTAWYPNGTVYMSDQVMTTISTGYYVWQGYMPAVGGTYLTQFNCTKSNQTALAWGEWQNPVWVARIAEALDIVNQTQYIITDLNGTIIGINATLEQIEAIVAQINLTVEEIQTEINTTQTLILDGFNSTLENLSGLQTSIEQNFTYTNSLIVETQIIANASVDRNDSLLAQLLYSLINHTGVPTTGNVTWTERSGPNPPRYWRYWWIKVDVEDEYGNAVYYPEVGCNLTTSVTGEEVMDFYTSPSCAGYYKGDCHGYDDEDDESNNGGGYFYSKVFVSSWDFSWSTTCYRI